ncbi:MULTISPECIES: hypothetical protein [unclassified Shinella]|uniref:hypothetical protein n=1 Tax=unclassified Shinella TaxID=2643062 RepID=UPI00234FA109|nr:MULTISPECIES: hypothetical protein [unclassified Shinella]MCO5152545.1 hypothetical protein [Shinella sp.]MDC7261838.1 hypothetical protein [Shinella sp. HY16]MDC7268733.1 hypothetical protein [Shinella sp. YZ44]
MSTTRTIADIIKDCGGARRISEASGLNSDGKPNLTHAAVYKWPLTGIRDTHWPLIMTLTATTPDELHSANCAARGVEMMAVSA